MAARKFLKMDIAMIFSYVEYLALFSHVRVIVDNNRSTTEHDLTLANPMCQSAQSQTTSRCGKAALQQTRHDTDGNSLFKSE